MVSPPANTSPGADAVGVRRPWTGPRLVRHESMTVLTQSVLGPHVGVPFLLQITCSGQGGCGPSGP
ncbi:MAG: hypothetical protein IRY91_06640 [Gemmatimonadaceae bacterium]|nr:hypothetical protein [Gemmatimonadaceae bacterium]